MDASYHLRAGSNDSILVDGKSMNQIEFEGLLRRAGKHKISFHGGEILTFHLERNSISNEWIVQTHSSSSGLDYFYSNEILPKLEKAETAILDQEEIYLN